MSIVVGGTHSKKPYPVGVKREITDEWLAQVDARLASNKSKGLSPASRAELMEAIGVDKSSMSNLWGTESRKRAQTSKLVDPICELLGLQLPTVRPEQYDDQEREWVEVLRGIPEPMRKHWLELMKATRSGSDS